MRSRAAFEGALGRGRSSEVEAADRSLPRKLRAGVAALNDPVGIPEARVQIFYVNRCFSHFGALPNNCPQPTYSTMMSVCRMLILFLFSAQNTDESSYSGGGPISQLMQNWGRLVVVMGRRQLTV